jgi:hypothetical protein
MKFKPLLSISSLACLSLLTACSTASLSKAGRQVEVVGRDDVKNCIEVEKLEGKGSKNFLEIVGDMTVTNRAISDAMNKAGKKGATHVVLGTVYTTSGQDTLDVKINAISYNCSKSRPSADSI